MDNELWSLRNKLEDVQKALESGNLAWARMAALELGIRLNHAEAAWKAIKERIREQFGTDLESRLKAMTTALAELREDLTGYAALHGGRFYLFGSAARGDYKINSDIDILVDFPQDKEDDAWRYAENACWSRGLKQDIRPKEWCSASFLEHVLKTSVVLGDTK